MSMYYKESTGIIIQDNLKRVLILKRTTNRLWTFPGGKVDEGETSLECAIRELKEETGIENVDLSLYTCTTSFTNNQNWKEKTYIGYVSSNTKFTNMEPHKFDRIEFIHLDELPPFSEIEPYDHLLIEQLRGEKEQKLEHDF